MVSSVLTSIRNLSIIVLGLSVLVACGNEPSVQNRGSLIVTPGKFTFPKFEEMNREAGISRSVRLENEGPGPIELIEIDGSFDDNNFTLFYELNLEGRQLFPGTLEIGSQGLPKMELVSGDTVTFYLVFNPEDINSLPIGALNLRTNAASVSPREIQDSSDETKVRIPIEGIRAQGELRIAPSDVDFGRTTQGNLNTEAVTITNVGSLPVLFQSYEVFGSSDFGVFIDDLSAADAQVAMAGGGDDPRCAGMASAVNDPRINSALQIDPDRDGVEGLAPGVSFTLCATFSSVLEVAQTGSIEITTDAEPSVRVIELRANAEGPCLNVSPNPLDFGVGLVNRRNEKLLTLESCGTEPVRIDSIEIIAGGETFSIVEESLPATPPFALPGAAATAATRPSRAISIAFTPAELIAYGGQLRVMSNDAEQPEKIIDLSGRGSENQCPVASVPENERNLRVRPLDVISLSGIESVDPDGPDQKPTRYRWTIVSRPSGSTSQPVESFNNPLRPEDGGVVDNESTAEAFFWVDLTGNYDIELTVVDEQGFEAPSSTCPQEPVRIRVEAVPDEDFTIELVWNTPADDNQTDSDGTDMDLHVGHPTATAWFDRDLDCHYRNPIANWGNSDSQNATLDVDDVDGAGPEKISILEPENTQDYSGRPYRVAVHYYSDAGGFLGGAGLGASDATVKITLRGQMVTEFTQRMNNWDLWEVAGIIWTPSDRRIQELNTALVEFPPPGL
jgi:hypothetical protein